MYLVFTRTPGESYRRLLRSLLLCLCDVFRGPVNSLVCWFCTSALGLVLFQIVGIHFKFKQKHQLLWAKDHWKHIQPVDHINCELPPIRSYWSIDWWSHLYSAVLRSRADSLRSTDISCCLLPDRWGQSKLFVVLRVPCWDYFQIQYCSQHDKLHDWNPPKAESRCRRGGGGNTALGSV